MASRVQWKAITNCTRTQLQVTLALMRERIRNNYTRVSVRTVETIVESCKIRGYSRGHYGMWRRVACSKFTDFRNIVLLPSSEQFQSTQIHYVAPSRSAWHRPSECKGVSKCSSLNTFHLLAIDTRAEFFTVVPAICSVTRTQQEAPDNAHVHGSPQHCTSSGRIFLHAKIMVPRTSEVALRFSENLWTFCWYHSRTAQMSPTSKR